MDVTESNPKRRRTKHISRACNPCRRRKIRCDGERPACALCVIYNDTCTYDVAQDRRRPVPKAYVSALEDRVAWLEKMLERQQETEGAVPRAPSRAASPPPEPRVIPAAGKVYQEPVDCLQIDNGEVREYGPTSMFKHLTAVGASPASTEPSETTLSEAQTVQQQASSDEVDLPPGLDQAMHEEALQAFFAFFNPWNWWVDEKQFRRDMPSGSTAAVAINTRTAYYSPLLHFAMLSLGVMYLETPSYVERVRLSDALSRRGAAFFDCEIEEAKLSAVVGFLLLGSHHAGHARQSLGYIYAGTGLRLSRILGLGIDASSWVHNGLISSETKRSRDRVWHTAYIQDKLWSTYVGRAPAPNLSHWRMPFPAMDSDDDAEPWSSPERLSTDPVQRSWQSLTFLWTCKLARVIELVLTNIYSTRTNFYSNKAQNAKNEICLLLERWQRELPEPLCVNLTLLRSQDASTPLPHVLTMNMMYNFAVILLNRPDYCDTSKISGAAKIPQNPVATTATETCHQAAVRMLRLVELFDRHFGLRHACVSMTQFVFTAGTIHLLGVANGKSVKSDTALSNGCIAALYAMGQTWKCAAQSGDVLQRLLREWHPELARSGEVAPQGATSREEECSAVTTTATPIDMQQVLRQNPDVAEQLCQLGWVPPVQGEPAATGCYTQQQQPMDIGTNDMSWVQQLSGWTDHSYVSALPPIQEQSLLDLLMTSEGLAPEGWSNWLFHGNLGSTSMQ